MKKIVIANDHGALELKKEIIEHLAAKGIDVLDNGANTNDSVDYPDFADKACKTFLSNDDIEFGILLCGTGIGISIAANKIDGIRCALPQNIFAARMAKEHNNANFLAFGGRIEYQDKVTDMIDAFMESAFLGGRHQDRVKKIMNLEN